jgi:DNA-binding GntR family transcriptional regulator
MHVYMRILYNLRRDDVHEMDEGGTRLAARSGLEMLKIESTSAIVAQRVRSGILDGTFPPGTQLAEIDLAAQLGVSRGPVREALQRLIHEGLARSERNRGVFVVDLDASDARDVYFVRSVIETTAACRLAKSRDEAAIGRLEAVVEQMEAMKDQPWSALVDIDLEFHRVLVSSAGSERLDRIFTTLSAETTLCLLYLERFYPDRIELVAEHQGFISVIRAGDVEVIEAVVDEHMRAAIERITSDEAP